MSDAQGQPEGFSFAHEHLAKKRRTQSLGGFGCNITGRVEAGLLLLQWHECAVCVARRRCIATGDFSTSAQRVPRMGDSTGGTARPAFSRAHGVISGRVAERAQLNQPCCHCADASRAGTTDLCSLCHAIGGNNLAAGSVSRRAPTRYARCGTGNPPLTKLRSLKISPDPPANTAHRRSSFWRRGPCQNVSPRR